MRAATLAALLVSSSALADGPRASAVELFSHGRALAAENKCDEAIPFFRDTLKLEPSVGALLNLAECEEKLGHASAAFTSYHAAEALARDKHDDREGLAHARWTALVPLVPKLAIVAAPGVSVTVDGRAASNDPMALPTGDHVIRATAPGKRAYETHVQLESADVVETVPALEPDVRTVRVDRGGGVRATGLVTLAGGAAALATGFICGGVALAKKSDADALSTGPSETAFDDARATAKSFADASTVLVVAGAAVAVVGFVVWLAAPHARSVLAPTGVAFRF
jgi:hypothetical protein